MIKLRYPFYKWDSLSFTIFRLSKNSRNPKLFPRSGNDNAEIFSHFFPTCVLFIGLYFLCFALLCFTSHYFALSFFFFDFYFSGAFSSHPIKSEGPIGTALSILHKSNNCNGTSYTVLYHIFFPPVLQFTTVNSFLSKIESIHTLIRIGNPFRSFDSYFLALLGDRGLLRDK